ncbi:RNA-directed DNA polymerase [Thiopseudomonas alkaliphila]|uniref:RNA-directed DNA polymerase n=1 Tax=Thiopseudomonas alkaliphila TaxID=1697053 RepID=UPI0025755450|nr:RNA-directed DNA polymerase [Thiopseudomonas alkaliphila]MDM1708018.1 RNA-directed DNA polymerase [Thiopseudomonas alkaliphila]
MAPKVTTENFTYKEGELNSAFALSTKNIIKFGDTDIFPFPYETRMFSDVFGKLIQSLNETHRNFIDRLNDCPPVNISTCSTVGYNGYRWATQIDPYWNAYFLGLVLSISEKIEGSRVSSEYVYSYRYSPNFNLGSLFDKDINWRKFQSDSLELAKKNESVNYILTCDIADFYTRIYHHRLENALDRIDPQKEISSKIKKLIQNFSGTNSYGLPVGGPAARILAELALDSLDHILLINGVQFKRYVDDFIIFCATKEEAHSVLTLISRKLMENEGLTLQKHKTNILSKDEFTSLTQSKLFGLDADKGSPMKAKFMSLPIRFDPYSQNAAEQYEEIKEELSNFDLLGMLSDELQKSKINQPFSKQLVRSFASVNDTVLSNAFNIIFNSINELYPIFNTVIQVATTNWSRFDEPTKKFIRDKLIELIKAESFILKTELNLAYVVKLFAKENSVEGQTVLTEIYRSNTDSILISLVVTQAMAKWNTHYWLSELRRTFPTMTSWQRRLFIVSSYLLGDEGKHWLAHNKARFNFIDEIYKEWGGLRKNSRNLEEAL